MRRQGRYTPGDTGDRGTGTDAHDQPGVPDRDVMVDRALRAKLEVECFINGNIGDSTKGWPVLSSKARKQGTGPA